MIGGNNGQSVQINGAGASGNTVIGNFIGTDKAWTKPIPNGAAGYADLLIEQGAARNTVGGSRAAGSSICDGSCNLISGIGPDGVAIEATNTDMNMVQGHDIGTDISGSLELANGAAGIRIDTGAEPQPNAIAMVVQAFANAPVARSAGGSGVNLHASVDEEVPTHDPILPCCPC